MKQEIIQGDCLCKLKFLEKESVDLLCTDPPYGYSFMGKSWDKTLPDIGIFKECFRVLKPGAFAFVMSAPRSDVCARMMLLLEDAGFNIGFTPIYWTYASGFPKAMNIGKMVDKRLGTYKEGKPNKNARFANQPIDGDYNHSKITREFTAQSKEAKALDGSYGGFQPKPAVEVIIVAMKPLSEKTYVDQALKNGKGITWLDDCRVPLAGDKPRVGNAKKSDSEGYGVQSWQKSGTMPESGRFPANLLVQDDVLNDGRVIKANVMKKGGSGGGYHFDKNDYNGDYSREGADSGSYSRYFSLDAWAKTLPFLIVPKASKREKNEGLEEFGSVTVGDGRKKSIDNAFQRGKTERVNSHPTVKPLKLMSYLITLGSRPGDTVLDPFLGSGTTAVAAKQLGRNYIGIEREEEYVKIARARLKAIAPSLL